MFCVFVCLHVCVHMCMCVCAVCMCVRACVGVYTCVCELCTCELWMCAWACVCVCDMLCGWRLENSLQQSALFFYHVGPRGWTWDACFGGKLLYPMSHPHGPFFFFFVLWACFLVWGRQTIGLLTFFIMLWAFPGSSLTPDLEAVSVPPDFFSSLAISAKSAWPPHTSWSESIHRGPMWSPRMRDITA